MSLPHTTGCHSTHTPFANQSQQGVTGFLTSKDYSTYYGATSPPLLPGTLLDVCVSAPPAAGPDGVVVQVGGCGFRV
jgi:hypothetical protein